ncbi:unnamed protein product [Zymoseptoria tritici ST99CH_1A5]|uniref:Uncharacterized protein n=1 Tax=Zymoseptoria tritici ST99CH_1A5 TaxID=1276529 RepID=A0A1Y6M1X3_ZYMTR|nr:unnamed protein product [Zymoseptoria tritici ST99CH_1A5]
MTGEYSDEHGLDSRYSAALASIPWSSKISSPSLQQQTARVINSTQDIQSSTQAPHSPNPSVVEKRVSPPKGSSSTESSDAPPSTAFRRLLDLLTQQQLVDLETVFSPIGELKMDEVFRTCDQAGHHIATWASTNAGRAAEHVAALCSEASPNQRTPTAKESIRSISNIHPTARSTADRLRDLASTMLTLPIHSRKGLQGRSVSAPHPDDDSAKARAASSQILLKQGGLPEQGGHERTTECWLSLVRRSPLHFTVYTGPTSHRPAQMVSAVTNPTHPLLPTLNFLDMVLGFVYNDGLPKPHYALCCDSSWTPVRIPS